MQLIFQGKTTRSLPKGINFPDDFHLTFTENHWSNEEKCIQHIKTIVVLYIESKRNIITVYVPANMMKYFQPLDLTVNGVSKTFLKQKFGDWYASEVTKKLNSGSEIYSI